MCFIFLFSSVFFPHCFAPPSVMMSARARVIWRSAAQEGSRKVHRHILGNSIFHGWGWGAERERERETVRDGSEMSSACDQYLLRHPQGKAAAAAAVAAVVILILRRYSSCRYSPAPPAAPPSFCRDAVNERPASSQTCRGPADRAPAWDCAREAERLQRENNMPKEMK